MMWSSDTLLAFEADIADRFGRGEILSPVHLAGGNERELIELFKDIAPQDWVLCQWRSHYHCLLKGVPADEVKAAILANQSMALCFPKHRILCSAIVGGVAPIAVGLGIACKKHNEATFQHPSRVHVFIGDMTAETGIAHESMKYAAGHGLPIKWIIEDNGLSVCTDTRATWGDDAVPDVTRYAYKLSRPHCGIGQWVRF